MQPLIGLSMDASDREASGKIYWLKQNYIEAVKKAGGASLPLPPTHDDKIIQIYLELLHGLVITGGDFDIHPRHYQASDQGQVRSIQEDRTGFEMKMFKGALVRKMPVLGVCGGMQLINVAMGGSLLQHVDRHERCEHEIILESQSLLHNILASQEVRVNSTHHQAVDRLGNDLLVSAKSPDGVIEAIEGKNQFLLGVQWHPEALADSRQQGIYQELIAAALRYQEQRHGQ